MTTPWKTWMRERLPSTTRTCTLTVSPGRKSGMSPRNESASSASRVFISAVLMFWPVLTTAFEVGADSGSRQQLLQRGRQPGRDEDLVRGGDLGRRPPAVRLVLVRLDLRLAADVDLVDD